MYLHNKYVSVARWYYCAHYMQVYLFVCVCVYNILYSMYSMMRVSCVTSCDKEIQSTDNVHNVGVHQPLI